MYRAPPRPYTGIYFYIEKKYSRKRERGDAKERASEWWKGAGGARATAGSRWTEDERDCEGGNAERSMKKKRE